MLTIALVVAVVVGILRGGRLSNLGSVKFRGLPLYALALCLQLTAKSSVFGVGVAGYVYVTSFGLLLAGAAMDRKTPGVILIFAGLLSNALVIVLNGGKMPVLATVDQVARSSVQAATHVSLGLSGRLWLLGDVFRVQLGPSRLLVSVGDLLLVAGAFILIQHFMVGDSQVS